MDATTYLDGIDVGENVPIIGGGLTGCEIAYDLILKGKKPTVIEMKNDLIAVKGVCLANSSFLREMLKYKKAPVYLNTKVKEILKDGVIVETSDGKTQKNICRFSYFVCRLSFNAFISREQKCPFGWRRGSSR